MTARSLLLRLAIVAAVAALPVPASAQGDGGQGFRISVTVPGFCEVQASPIVIDEVSGLATATVFESCNMQDGFLVAATHRELGAEEKVALNYAGHATTLSRSGWSPIVSRVGARHGTRPLSVRYLGLETSLALNISITMF